MRSKIISAPALIILFVFISVMSFSGCRVPLCDTDTEKPLLSFSIHGPGYAKTYRSDNPATLGEFIDYLQLNMNPGVTYNFIISLSDACGAHDLRVQFDHNFTLSELKDGDGNSLTEILSGDLKFVEVAGMITNDSVKTSLMILGKFTTPGLQSTGASFTIRSYGSDYGGRRGSPNSARLNLGFLIQAGIVPGEIRL